MSISRERPLRASGGCLCGAVRYHVYGPLRDVINCHCSQCRLTHGHYSAYTACALEDLVLEQDRGLTWFQSSARARRGFCAGCGSSLFWEPLGKNTISISAGTLEPPTGLKTVRHIYVAAAGDYYDISDNLEKLPAGMEE